MMKLLLNICLVTVSALVLWLPVPAHAVRIFTTGYEENCTTTCMWGTSGGNAQTIVTTAPHSGTYRVDTSASAGNSNLKYTKGTTNTSGTYFTRFYMRTSTSTPSANSNVYTDLSNGSVTGLTLTILTGGNLRLTNSVTGTSATDGVTTLVANTWYRVEIDHLLSDTVGTMTVRLYDDGNPASLLETIGPITGEDTLPTDIKSFQLGKSASTATFSYDDVAWNDSTGSFQTGAPGAGKVYLLIPDSDVSITWKDHTGAAVATFAEVDDLPGAPDDLTTFNQDLLSLSDFDRLGLTNLGAEVTSDATIALVAVYGRVGSNQTSATHMQLKIWDEGSTLTDSPSITANVNGFRLITDAEYLILNTTGKTKSNLDSFNVGYQPITDLFTRPRYITALWAEVEWIEAAPSGSLLQSPSVFGRIIQ